MERVSDERLRGWRDSDGSGEGPRMAAELLLARDVLEAWRELYPRLQGRAFELATRCAYEAVELAAHEYRFAFAPARPADPDPTPAVEVDWRGVAGDFASALAGLYIGHPKERPQGDWYDDIILLHTRRTPSAEQAAVLADRARAGREA